VTSKAFSEAQEAEAGSAAVASDDPAERAVVLGGVLLLLAGTLSVIEGAAALAGSAALADPSGFIVGGSSSWGTALVVLGCAAGLIALALWAGGRARWIAVAIAAANAVVLLVFTPAYPVWSLASFALYVLAILELVARVAHPRGAPS
jgi:hypothetical protein